MVRRKSSTGHRTGGGGREKKSEALEIEATTSRYEQFDASGVESFSDLPLSTRTRRGLETAGFVAPTEIQREAIGFALRGLDVLGAAHTGSGKTLAFLVPVLECLWRRKWTRLDGLGALVVSPTRELALQTFHVLRNIGGAHDFSAALITGGTVAAATLSAINNSRLQNVQFEKARLQNTNVVVCTPGRLLQHMDENSQFETLNLQILVLDEADRILDLGFETQINAILANLSSERQTLLFSATQTKSLKLLARLSLKDPVYVSAHEHAEFDTPEHLSQSYTVIEESDKINFLWSFLVNHKRKKSLVFLTTCKQVRYVADALRRLRPGLSLMALFGRMQHKKRMKVYEEFCTKPHAVMLATDVAARGLDFAAVDWVLQADCPPDALEYIHRVGRTARLRRDGQALLLLTPAQHAPMLALLHAHKIPIDSIAANPNKLHDISKKLESLCAADPLLKTFAQRCFVSYVRAIFVMSNKQLFDVSQIDTDATARSLGLTVTPRLRFLKKAERRPVGEKAVGASLSTMLDDFLVVKRQHVFAEDEADSDGAAPTERPSVAAAAARPLSKAAAAKRLLRRRAVESKKTVFRDSDGEDEQQPSTVVAEVEQKEEDSAGGMDLEAARLSMQAADREDRALYRQRLRERRLERKRKQKEREGQTREREPRVELAGGGGVTLGEAANEAESDEADAPVLPVASKRRKRPMTFEPDEQLVLSLL